MNITAAVCDEQGEALLQAGLSSPVTMIRRPLLKRSKEWTDAAEDLRAFAELNVDQEVEVVLSGSIEPGCTVVLHGQHFTLIRPIFDRDRMALHTMRDDNGRDEYINLWGNRTSPVVVLR